MAVLCRELALDTYLRLAPSYERMRNSDCTREDTFEAFVGALYMAYGFDCAYIWTTAVLEEHYDISDVSESLVHPREGINQMCRQGFGAPPRFETKDGVTRVLHPNDDIELGVGIDMESACREAMTGALALLERSTTL